MSKQFGSRIRFLIQRAAQMEVARLVAGGTPPEEAAQMVVGSLSRSRLLRQTLEQEGVRFAPISLDRFLARYGRGVRPGTATNRRWSRLDESEEDFIRRLRRSVRRAL